MRVWVSIAIAAVAGGSLATRAPEEPEAWLEAGPLGISEEGYRLILEHEVGGGSAYYSRYLSRPTWPGAASGVTIGVGYDLGYHSRRQIAGDWDELPADTVRRLQSVAGVKGAGAKRLARSLRSIVIPWRVAQAVYQEVTIPRWAARTERAYDGTAATHQHVQGAMLSWTFNRGSGISGRSRDREKRAIRAALPAHVERVPGAMRASKRLWRGRGLAGLLRRREDEARLVEAGIRAGR